MDKPNDRLRRAQECIESPWSALLAFGGLYRLAMVASSPTRTATAPGAGMAAKVRRADVRAAAGRCYARLHVHALFEKHPTPQVDATFHQSITFDVVIRTQA